MYITHAKTIQAIEKAASGAATVCLFLPVISQFGFVSSVRQFPWWFDFPNKSKPHHQI